jgi:hypothetical protein
VQLEGDKKIVQEVSQLGISEHENIPPDFLNSGKFLTGRITFNIQTRFQTVKLVRLGLDC